MEHNDKFKAGNYASLCQYEAYGYSRKTLEEEFQSYIRKYDLDAKRQFKTKDEKEKDSSVRQRYF